MRKLRSPLSCLRELEVAGESLVCVPDQTCRISDSLADSLKQPFDPVRAKNERNSVLAGRREHRHMH